MPYEVRERDGKHCVAKKGGDIMKCYPKRDDAIRYMRALYANVPDAQVAAAVDFTDGSMVAVFPRPLEQASLAAPGGQPPQELHVTLAFLPNGVDGDEAALSLGLALAGLVTDPLEGKVGGVGAFEDNGDGRPVIALPDVVGLAELRQLVVDACEDAGVTFAETHGWTPHLTLGYGDGDYPDPMGRTLHFDAVSLVKGPERTDFPLVGVTDEPTMEDDDVDAAFDTVTAAAFTAKERRRLADEGVAMEDGSFPIRNASDLSNAIRALGRAKDRAAAVRHIRKRARALGLEDRVKNLTAASVNAEVDEPEADDDERAAKQLCPHCGHALTAAIGRPFDEAKHPRAPKGVREGGRFVAVAQGPGSYTVEDTATGETVAQTHTAAEAVAVQDDLNAQDEPAPGEPGSLEQALTTATDDELQKNLDTYMAAPDSPTRSRAIAAINAEMQTRYQGLLDEARSLGIPTSLDDPNTPQTVADLRSAVANAKTAQGLPFESGERVILNNGDKATVVKSLGTVPGKPQAYSIVNDSGHASWAPETEMTRLASDEGAGMQQAVTAIDEAARRSTEIARGTTREGIVSAGITASAAGMAPDVPPAEWFEDPNLDGPTPLTVTADGRVFGHVAPWNVCHTGIQGRCVTPPKSRSDYAYFNLGAVQTDKGVVSAGKITMDTGHAPLSASSRVAASHYDHTGVVAADVRAGEDEHGIWIAGAVRPDLDAGQARKLERATVSGDWRRIDGDHEMVGLLAVNVPGFPIPRAQALVASSGEQEFVTALVAAGVMCGCDEDMELERELDELVASSVPAVKLAMAGAPAARK